MAQPEEGDFAITFKKSCNDCPFCVDHEYFPPYCNITATHPKMPRLEPQNVSIPPKCPLIVGDVIVRFKGI